MENQIYGHKISLLKFQILNLLLISLVLYLFLFFLYWFLPPFILDFIFGSLNYAEMEKSKFSFLLNHGLLLVGCSWFIITIFLFLKKSRELAFWLKKEHRYFLKSEKKESELLTEIEAKIKEIITIKLDEAKK